MKSNLQEIADDLLSLLSEIDCRKEHGAAGPGHFEYIEGELKKIIDKIRECK